MMTFAEVKARISIFDFCQHYGIVPKHRDRILCPFHDDHDPSMKISERGFYCFACGAHGDLIRFAAQYFGCSPSEAKNRLAADFNLENCGYKSDFKEALKRTDQSTEFGEALDILLWAVQALKKYKKKLDAQATPDNFTETARCSILIDRLDGACTSYFEDRDSFKSFLELNEGFMKQLKEAKSKYGRGLQ